MSLLNIRHGDKVFGGGPAEYQYLHLLSECVNKAALAEGPKADRTGTGTYGVFGRQIRFNLNHGFPLLTTKKLFFKGIVAELLWMLSGSTNIAPLVEQGVHIWDEWADAEGSLGPVYGEQWRAWPTGSFKFDRKGKQEIVLDQIAAVIKSLKEDPGSRRHVVSAWNPGDLPRMALAPCHCLFQFYVEDGKLSCQLYQRSADIFLGVPFNIASYALLTALIARECDLKLGEFIHTFGDLHLYSNHVDQARGQLNRVPRPFPLVQIRSDVGMFDLTTNDIRIIAYDPHPPIKAEVSI